MIDDVKRHLGSYFTPLSDGDGNCERTCAELRIYPGVVSPAEVTRRLGIEPTSYVSRARRSRSATPGEFVSGASMAGSYRRNRGLCRGTFATI